MKRTISPDSVGFVLAVLLLLMGCETRFDLELPEEPTLAVSSSFSPQTGFEVFLTPVLPFAQGPNDDLITSADVKVIAGTNERSLTVQEDFVGRRRYVSVGFIPVAGAAYDLLITDSIYGTLTATDRIPLGTEGELSDAQLISADTLTDGRVRLNYHVTFRFDDRDFVADFYHLFLEVHFLDNANNAFFGLSEITNVGGTDPSLSFYLSEQSILLDGSFFDGLTKEYRLGVSFTLPPGGELQSLQSDFRHVSEDYYQYYLSQAAQVNTGGSATIQPTQLYSNIDGGEGVFAGFYMDRDTLMF